MRSFREVLPQLPLPVRGRLGVDKANPVSLSMALFAERMTNASRGIASDDQAKGFCEETAGATLEHRHQLMNTEATVDNNFELFEAQRVEEIKVTAICAARNTNIQSRPRCRVDHDY